MEVAGADLKCTVGLPWEGSGDDLLPTALQRMVSGVSSPRQRPTPSETV